MQKMKRFFLQDDDAADPQKFFKIFQKANDLLPCIQPTGLTVNVDDKLSESELLVAFCQSLPPDWEIEAKNCGHTSDTFKLFTFLNHKHKKKLREREAAKKRKAEERKDNQSKRHRTDYNITNMQGSQYNYNPRSDQSSYSNSTRGSYRGRGFRGRGFNDRGRGRGIGGGYRGRGRGPFQGPPSQYSQNSQTPNQRSQSGQRPWHNSIEEINVMQRRHDDMSSVSQSQYGWYNRRYNNNGNHDRNHGWGDQNNNSGWNRQN